MNESPDMLEVALTTQGSGTFEILSRLSNTGTMRVSVPLEFSVPTQTKSMEAELSGFNLFARETRVVEFDDAFTLTKRQHALQKPSPRKARYPMPSHSRLTSRRPPTEQYASINESSINDGRLLKSSLKVSRTKTFHPTSQRKTPGAFRDLFDGVSISLDRSLAALLSKAIKRGLVSSVVKDLYLDAATDEFPKSFVYLFSLGMAAPIESVKDLPTDCDIVVISPRPRLSYNLKRTGFNAESLVLFNLQLFEEGSEAARAYIKYIERYLNPRNPIELDLVWRAQQKLIDTLPQDYLPNRLLNALDFSPWSNGDLSKSLSPETHMRSTKNQFKEFKEADYKNTYKARMVLPKHLSNSPVRSKRGCSERINSKNFIDNSSQLIKLCLLSQKLPVIGRSPRKFSNSPEKKYSFVDKPSKLAKLKTTNKALQFASKGEAAKSRAVKLVKDRVISQIGSVDAYCFRYSLTEAEFIHQLEEFAVLALESSKGVGVHPHLLSTYYNTNVYALRGINPHFLDLDPVDKLDIHRFITPSMLLSWQEYTLYYSLAITQRAHAKDILRFLLTLARITHASQLSKDSVFEALKSKFLNPHFFTVELQQVWTKLAETVAFQGCHNESLSIDELVEAAIKADVSVSELRHLAGAAFKAQTDT